MAFKNAVPAQPTAGKKTAGEGRMKFGQEPKRDAAGTVSTEYKSVKNDGKGLGK